MLVVVFDQFEKMRNLCMGGGKASPTIRLPKKIWPGRKASWRNRAPLFRESLRNTSVYRATYKRSTLPHISNDFFDS